MRETDTDRITEKIAALLRLAEGAATDGERDAALAQAAKLAAKYNIDVESIDATAPDGFDECWLTSYAREPLWLGPVLALLQEYFFVAAWHENRRKQRTRVMLVGLKHNRLIAVHVYVFLSRSFEQGWKTFAKQRGSRRGERSYHSGVFLSLDNRLREERDGRAVSEQHALIRVNQAAQDALDKRHPDLTCVRPRNLGSSDDLAFLQGIADGEAIQIRKALRDAQDDETTFLDASA